MLVNVICMVGFTIGMKNIIKVIMYENKSKNIFSDILKDAIDRME